MSKLAEQIKQELIEQHERGIEPFDEASVVLIPRPGCSDFSDWVDLMEVVEVLCPTWPARPKEKYGEFKL
jgi:hypothetical protein